MAVEDILGRKMKSIVSCIKAAESEYGSIESIKSPISLKVKELLEAEGRSDLALIIQESEDEKLHVVCSGREWLWGGFDLRYT